MNEPDDKKAILTLEERNELWHWCHEFDGLLRQPMDESDVLQLKGEGFKCSCHRDDLMERIAEIDRLQRDGKMKFCSTPNCCYPDGKPCLGCDTVVYLYAS